MTKLKFLKTKKHFVLMITYKVNDVICFYSFSRFRMERQGINKKKTKLLQHFFVTNKF